MMHYAPSELVFELAKKKKRYKNKQKEERILAKARKAALAFLRRNPQRFYNHKQIAAGTDLKGRVSGSKFLELLEEMADKGKIERHGRGKYGVSGNLKTIKGKIAITRDGIGFVQPEDGSEEIFVPPRSVEGAFGGDIVAVEIVRGPRRHHKAEGRVVEIIERAVSQFVGNIEMMGENGLFIPDHPGINVDFLIRPDDLGGAEDGQKVLVEITEWVDRFPEARVLKVLGDPGEHNVEMHAILYQFGFDPDFPAHVEAEADKLPTEITREEVEKRRDMRDVMTFTIDPVDAKDFDDAISFKVLKDDLYEIGVHIADVSHYVQPGTEIDREAYRRGTSVYLVDRTVPMLPEKLSNEVCSLRPNEDKLTFSAVFEMDSSGKVHKEWFGRTVIHSDRRFAYEEAQEEMDKGGSEEAKALLKLNEIAHLLRKDRFRKGSILIEEDEVRFELDDEGVPIRVYRKIRMDTHRLIEDFMLLANRRVCKYIATLRKDPPLPFVYRIHAGPDPEKLAQLQMFVRFFGYELELAEDGNVQEALNGLMRSVMDKPEQHVINTVTVRAMAKAVYSIQNIGHYGLGFRFYTHFTSPIRRYPDLMVHRLLAKYLSKEYKADAAWHESACQRSSNMERKATEAERASIKYKQVEFLQDKIGKEYDGIVSGVTNRGIYVEIIENKCEGMVSLNDLEDDYYELDDSGYRVIGRRNGRVVSLGDKVRIEIKDTDIDRRLIDFELVEFPEGSLPSKMRKKHRR